MRRQLEDLVNVSWLSIHRQNEEPQTMEERKSIPPIDQKISSLNNSLVKYFSSLSKRHSDNITEFQKRILLSVITSERSEALSAFLKDIDIDRETMALTGVFEVLGVEKKHYAQKIRNHFEKFNQAIESSNKEDAKFSFDQFSAIYNTWRSHSLVQDYEKLQNKKIDIFKSRDIFIEVLNNLLGGRKKVSISERNELFFQTASDRRIPLSELSSGEKQLLIILGESLLQQEMPVIYIADEPELSLHLKWQEALISSISKLNNNAQIIGSSSDRVGRVYNAAEQLCPE